MHDEEWMAYAITVGQKARITAPPNPWVGCVIVKDGSIIGEGFSQPAGHAHAEVMALKQAENAEGATAYVTLEPCCHHGLTPPCTDALIKAKVKRVVIALLDPDPRVSGNGVKQLQQAGITVDIGICAKQAALSFEPYLWQRQTGRAFCVVKAAISIDGRIAARDHSSQWITCEKARVDAHYLRAESQAILVGAGTAMSDKPSLTIRHGVPCPPKPPLRVVLDSTGQVMVDGPLFNLSLAPTLIVTSDKCPEKRINDWKSAGAEVMILPLARVGSGIDLESVLQLLGKRGIIQVLVEGGAKLINHLWEEKLINRLVVYTGACLLGSEGIPLIPQLDVATISDAPRLQLRDVYRIDSTIRADYNL